MSRLASFLIFAYQWSFRLSLIIVKQLVHNKTTEQFMDAEAFFGPHVTDENPVSGYLFAASPLNGCTDSIPLPENASHRAIPFICLIKRGNCNFDDKVRAAQRGGYSAAIVYNHLDDDIFPMGSQSALPVTIPSFMVGLSDGKKFLNYSSNYEDYVFEVYPNGDAGFEVYLIPVLSMLGIFVLGVISMFIYRWNEQRRRRRRRCLTSRQVSRLPVSKFIKGQSPDGACVICLEDYENNDKLRRLPCGHMYHTKCIDPWLLKNSRLCPMCKRPVYPRDAGNRPRRPFMAYFRHWSGRDQLEDRLISEAESPDGTDDDVERYSDESPHPGTSYGTVVLPQQPQRQHHRPRSFNDEATPLLFPTRLTSRPHSSHSVPSNLHVVVNSVGGPGGTFAPNGSHSFVSGSKPETTHNPRGRLSAPALYGSPANERRMSVDPADIVIHQHTHSSVDV